MKKYTTQYQWSECRRMLITLSILQIESPEKLQNLYVKYLTKNIVKLFLF